MNSINYTYEKIQILEKHAIMRTLELTKENEEPVFVGLNFSIPSAKVLFQNPLEWVLFTTMCWGFEIGCYIESN